MIPAQSRALPTWPPAEPPESDPRAALAAKRARLEATQAEEQRALEAYDRRLRSQLETLGAVRR